MLAQPGRPEHAGIGRLPERAHGGQQGQRDQRVCIPEAGRA